MKSVQNQVAPIFIVGMPRSGTTLLRTLLSAHRAIAITPETHFLSELVPRFRMMDLSNTDNFDKFWDAFSRSAFMLRSQLDPDETKERILASGLVDYRKVFTTVLAIYAESRGKKRCGEKTPGHYQYIDVLLRWYPQAKVIFVLRDPRAVVASLLEVHWAPKSAYANAQNWNRSCSILEQWSSDPRVLCLMYESLVTNTEHELRTVCEFVGEDWDPAVLDPANCDMNDENDVDVKTALAWSKAFLKSVCRPISTASVDKWRATLSSHQTAIIEHVTRDKMIMHGYQPVSEGLTLSQRTQWSMEIIRYTMARVFRALRSPDIVARRLTEGNRRNL